MQAPLGRIASGLLGALLTWGAPAAYAAGPADQSEDAAAQFAAQAAAAQRALLSSPADEAPHRVSRHYLWSNERRHDLFFEDIRGLGRGYLGVGADQNYTLAAAARADVAWLVDLDAAVVNLHHLYGAAIAAAPTPEEFLGLLSGRRDETLLAALQARIPDAHVRAAALAIYQRYGALLRQHLRRTQRQRYGAEARSWLGDPALYAHVRKLALAGRLLPRLCDLNGPSGMLQIGAAARAAGVPVRVLYLSNAESWFGYSGRFLRNLQALPLDEQSLVLRTVKSRVLRYPAGDVWHFSVQGALDFVSKLALRRYRSVDAIMADLQMPTGVQPGRLCGTSRIAPGVPMVPAKVADGLVTRPAASPSTPTGLPDV